MKQLNKQEIDALNQQIQTVTGKTDYFHKKDNIKEGTPDGKTIILRDRELLFFIYDGKPVPALKLLLKEPLLKTVTVDMGAVKFVAGGADVMRPGIKTADADVKKDDFVAVVDETHKKPLAVCQALFSSEEFLNMDKGKVLKNIHRVGDAIWTFEP